MNGDMPPISVVLTDCEVAKCEDCVLSGCSCEVRRSLRVLVKSEVVREHGGNR